MVTTLPTDGEFNFTCIHCGYDTGKPPIKKKVKGQDMALYTCGKCKELTLIRFDDEIATCFKVDC